MTLAEFQAGHQWLLDFYAARHTRGELFCDGPPSTFQRLPVDTEVWAGERAMQWDDEQRMRDELVS